MSEYVDDEGYWMSLLASEEDDEYLDEDDDDGYDWSTVPMEDPERDW